MVREGIEPPQENYEPSPLLSPYHPLYGNRTRIFAVKVQRPNHLDEEKRTTTVYNITTNLFQQKSNFAC